MDKIFVVSVRDWTEEFRMLAHSYHRTKKGAERAVEEAKKKYLTDLASFEEVTVED